MSTSPTRSALSSLPTNTSPKKAASPQKPSAMNQSENQNQGQVKSMDYHRQVLKGKLEDDSNGAKYVSPSDNIMSPCTQKLSALKGKQFGKAKPKSLFSQTAGKSAGAGSFDGAISNKETKTLGE